MFITGLSVFSLASLVGGLAAVVGAGHTPGPCKAPEGRPARPAALSLVTTTFRESRPEQGMGIWGAMAGAGAAAGVLLGGVLTSALDWRWVLFINVPVGIVCAALAPWLLAESRARSRNGFDLLGAITVTGGLGVLVYALVGVSAAGWVSVRTIALLVAAAALLVCFTLIERRAAAPLVPFRIFRIAPVAVANATMLLVGAAVLSLFFVLSLYMQQVLGYSPLKAGITQLPLAGTIVLAAGLTPALLAKLGHKPTLLIGLGMFTGGLAWFGRIATHGTFLADILGPSLLVAAGLGLAFVVLTTASVSGVSAHESGLASGLVNTSQQVGGSLGLAIITTIASTRTASVLRTSHAGPSAMPHALTAGFQFAFLTAAGFALLALAVVGTTRRWMASQSIPYNPHATRKATTQ